MALVRPLTRSAALAESWAGRIGHALDPVMQQVGFDWKTTTALIGASRPEQILENLKALETSVFSPDELEKIETILNK